MKNLLLLSMILFFSGCGSSDGGETPSTSVCGMPVELDGDWHNLTLNDTININTSTCRYTGSYCGSSGVVVPVKGTTNQYLLHILSNNGDENCAKLGIYNCYYQLQGPYLTVNCGRVVTYQR